MLFKARAPPPNRLVGGGVLRGFFKLAWRRGPETLSEGKGRAVEAQVLRPEMRALFRTASTATAALDVLTGQPRAS